MNLLEYRRMYEAEERHWWYVGLHRLILEIIGRESRRLGRPLDIFDAGCGTGRLCQLLAREGHRVAGCDLSAEAIGLARRRGVDTLYRADLNTIDLEPAGWDVITSLDVLYHTGITDDVAVMARLRTGLKPAGMLLLNLVAHEFLRSTHDIAVHTRERYSRDILCRRVREAGFLISQASYRVSILFPVIVASRLLSRMFRQRTQPADKIPSDVTRPHPPANGLLLSTLILENMLLRRHALPVGSSLFVVARKETTPAGS